MRHSLEAVAYHDSRCERLDTLNWYLQQQRARVMKHEYLCRDLRPDGQPVDEVMSDVTDSVHIFVAQQRVPKYTNTTCTVVPMIARVHSHESIHTCSQTSVLSSS